ncbi:MAG: hypothetical protein HQL49_04050 [Gammaproteobacteria bacterium]|nr:hypothetical protein [Gammaproteobacteria bacterium]
MSMISTPALLMIFMRNLWLVLLLLWLTPGCTLLKPVAESTPLWIFSAPPDATHLYGVASIMPEDIEHISEAERTTLRVAAENSLLRQLGAKITPPPVRQQGVGWIVAQFATAIFNQRAAALPASLPFEERQEYLHRPSGQLYLLMALKRETAGSSLTLALKSKTDQLAQLDLALAQVDKALPRLQLLLKRWAVQIDVSVMSQQLTLLTAVNQTTPPLSLSGLFTNQAVESHLRTLQLKIANAGAQRVIAQRLAAAMGMVGFNTQLQQPWDDEGDLLLELQQAEFQPRSEPGEGVELALQLTARNRMQRFFLQHQGSYSGSTPDPQRAEDIALATAAIAITRRLVQQLLE